MKVSPYTGRPPALVDNGDVRVCGSFTPLPKTRQVRESVLRLCLCGCRAARHEAWLQLGGRVALFLGGACLVVSWI